MTRRHFPRTLVEAFPASEAWRDVITHHKRPLAERVADVLKTLAVLATFAALGLMLGWRG